MTAHYICGLKPLPPKTIKHGEEGAGGISLQLRWASVGILSPVCRLWVVALSTFGSKPQSLLPRLICDCSQAWILTVKPSHWDGLSTHSFSSYLYPAPWTSQFSGFQAHRGNSLVMLISGIPLTLVRITAVTRKWQIRQSAPRRPRGKTATAAILPALIV